MHVILAVWSIARRLVFVIRYSVWVGGVMHLFSIGMSVFKKDSRGDMNSEAMLMTCVMSVSDMIQVIPLLSLIQYVTTLIQEIHIIILIPLVIRYILQWRLFTIPHIHICSASSHP